MGLLFALVAAVAALAGVAARRTVALNSAQTANNGHLSERQRWRIIDAFERLGSVSLAAKEAGVTKRVAKRWIKRHQESGSVSTAPSTGRPRALSEGAQDEALKLLREKQATTADQAAEMLYSEGISDSRVSRSTLIRGAKAAASRQGIVLHAVRGDPPKQLTKATIQKRISFCTANISTNWLKCMFTDRKRFLWKYPGTSVSPVRWAVKGEHEPGAYSPNHPYCVNIYAGITAWGATICHVVAGTSKHKTTYTNKKGDKASNITCSEYAAVLTKTLLPEGRRIFSTQGISDWTLQQDNDPAHKEAGAVIADWNNKHRSCVQLLANWPPNSPDLNPIENLWAAVMVDVNKAGCKTFEEFAEAVKLSVKEQGRKMGKALVGSMATRLAECIDAEGKLTGY